MSTTPPVISVVTVTYQSLVALQPTVRSLAQQDNAVVEYVVIDGGSTDGTVEWLTTAGPRTPDTLVSEPDEGIFHAMNKALHLVQGDVVQFLNAGDVYASPDVLGRVVQSYETSRWAWGYGLARVVDSEGRPYRPAVGLSRYHRLAHAYRLSAINHQASFVTAELLRRLGGFSERFGTASDFHILLRAGALAEPAVIPCVLINYRAGGISEKQVYAHLWRKHRARVDALPLGRVAGALDSAFTAGQVGYVAVRRMAKARMLQARMTRMVARWAQHRG